MKIRNQINFKLWQRLILIDLDQKFHAYLLFRKFIKKYTTINHNSVFTDNESNNDLAGIMFLFIVLCL